MPKLTVITTTFFIYTFCCISDKDSRLNHALEIPASKANERREKLETTPIPELSTSARLPEAFQNGAKTPDESELNFESSNRRKCGLQTGKWCNEASPNFNFEHPKFKEKPLPPNSGPELVSKNDVSQQQPISSSTERVLNFTDLYFTERDIAEFDPFNPRSDANNRLIMDENKPLGKRETNEYYDSNETNHNESEISPNKNKSKEDYLRDIKDYITPKPQTWVLIFLHSAVFVIGLVGNTLVCVAVYRNHTMRTITNYFIVNLAVADFWVILLCLPPTVIWDVTFTWFFGDIICKTVLYLQTVSVTVSVLTLTFISVDRWYAICFPLKFKSTTGRAKTAIGIIWLVALIFDIPELIVYKTRRNPDLPIDTEYFTQCEPSWSKETDTTWTLLKMILLYAIPLIFMTVAYCQIIRVLWQSGNVHQHSMDLTDGRHVNTFTMNANTSTEGQLRSRRKAAKMLVAVVVMFAVCYFPVHLLSLVRITVTLTNDPVIVALFSISHWLCYANSAVNPIIYNFMSGKFRKEFRRAFERCYQPSTNNQLGYQLSNMYPKNTEKDSGIGSRSQSRSSKRTLTEVRRLGTIERGFTDAHRTRRPSERTIVSKLEV